AVEIEVAEKREREDIDDVGVPIEFVQSEIKRADDASIFREMVEFASNRTSSDVAEMAFWLYRQRMNDYAAQLVGDYCRQRSIQSSVSLVRDAEKLPGAGADGMAFTHLTRSVGEAVGRRSLDEVLAFIEIHFADHRMEKSHPSPAAAIVISSAWLGFRGIKGRQEKFFVIIDCLNRLGQKEAADLLIRRQVGYSGSIGRAGKVIAESGRKADIGLFVTEWLGTVKKSEGGRYFHSARQLRRVAEFSNPLMFDMMVDGVLDAFDSRAIGEIYLYTSNGDGPNNSAFDRFTKKISKRRMTEEIRRALREGSGVELHIEDL
ncbi:hypothetical protein ACWD7F_36785, partial [Streptomyces sp. NPDC005122]